MTGYTGSNYYNGVLTADGGRNYSYLYQYSTYTSLWVAYPLTANDITGSASTSSWSYNDQISDKTKQINVISNSYGTNYGNSTYSRGHQIPAADRKSSSAKNAQTYLVTNQTPQIQNSFNSPMWSNLETAVRALTSGIDTVYVVTGATFQTVGGSETVINLTAAKTGIYPTTIYVPNYYWKVLLKVKRSGSTITSASAIGFWAPHIANPSAYTSYAVSVSTIEQYTGFDFFTNLPASLKNTAKANDSWTTFQNFPSN